MKEEEQVTRVNHLYIGDDFTFLDYLKGGNPKTNNIIVRTDNGKKMFAMSVEGAKEAIKFFSEFVNRVST